MAGLSNDNVVRIISELGLCIFLYGLYIPLGFVCFRHLLSNRNRTRVHYAMWTYFIIALSLATIFTATYLVSIGKELFCLTTAPQELRSNCGNVTLDKQLFTVKQTSLTAFKLNLLFADALSLYRLSVVWSDYRLVTAVPALIYLASLATNCYTIFTTFVVSWSMTQAGIITATVFDVTCTILIASRLLIRRKRAKNVSTGLRSSYATLATIFIESSMINAITRVVYAAAGGSNPDGTITWPALLAASGAIFAPTFIIIRTQLHVVSTKHSRRRRPTISTIRFADEEVKRGNDSTLSAHSEDGETGTQRSRSTQVDSIHPPFLPEMIALESIHFPHEEIDDESHQSSSMEDKTDIA